MSSTGTVWPALPIDPFVPAIRDALRRARAVVVTAQPGAGKTTRVPPALVDAGPVVLLQPRRVAARSIARRIAEERGWTIGREVGWQMRLERRFGPDTQLLVATEGILTARLQGDPLLSGFHTIVLDEFHERSIHADLAIALARQAWLARSDLRLVVMSATLDAGAVARFLGDCPVIAVPGRAHPLTIGYAPGVAPAEAALDLLARTTGDVLCFLPGALEIRRTIASLAARVEASTELVPLYGGLDSAEQDHALREAAPGRRRIVVATNIAETSITVPGVTGVVDSGTHKVARYDASRGVDSLTLERITADAADQRAGRAGRLASGCVTRLWDERDRLRPHREPEIHRVDLSAPALDVIAWGGDPRQLEWFDPPQADALDRALALLDRLDATAAGQLTATGRRMHRLPLHPRLARMLVASGGATRMARACALIAERHFTPGARREAATTASDLLSATDDWEAVAPQVQRAASEIGRLMADRREDNPAGRAAPVNESAEESFCRWILAGYPDRVAQRREPGSARVKLATGAGAVLTPESGVRTAEFLVAVDLQAAEGQADSRIRMASRVDRAWLVPTSRDVVHQLDEAAGIVRAIEMERYDALVLIERPAPLDPAAAAALLADAWLSRPPGEADTQLVRRLRFAGQEVDLRELVTLSAQGARSLGELRLNRGLAQPILQRLERDAPVALRVPSGRTVALHYLDDGTVRADVKLQELFGLGETPRVGARREPVLLALLSPGGRPVQMTRDLRSFWERTYPEVRRELRGRYPKHPWPEDPWNAVPTARTTRARK